MPRHFSMEVLQCDLTDTDYLLGIMIYSTMTNKINKTWSLFLEFYSTSEGIDTQQLISIDVIILQREACMQDETWTEASSQIITT